MYGVSGGLLLLMTDRHGFTGQRGHRLAARRNWTRPRAVVGAPPLKGGLSVEQPIAGDELRAIKRYLAMRADALPWLFVSERDQPLTREGVNYLVATAAKRAGLARVHPHTLRHSCGFALADKGLIQHYLGHRDLRHTVHYTRTAGPRFGGLWR